MIDKCIIMGLDKRKDLWTSLKYDCEQRGFNTEVFVVGSGLDKDLEYSHIDKEGIPQEWRWGQGQSAQRHSWAFQSHKEIIRKCIKKKYDSILLLEDDVYFTSRFDKHWPAIAEHISGLDFDCLYLGFHAYEYSNHLFAGRNIEIEEKYKRTGEVELTSIPQCGGLFAVILNKRIFPMLLNLPPVGPIDSQLNLYHNLISRIHISPPIMYVKSCFSECEQTYIERNIL